MKSRTVLFCAILLAALQLSAQPDPGARGPFAVAQADYNFGNLAFQPTGFPNRVELTGTVRYPQDLTQGPYPLVVFLHGRHVTCFQSGTGATTLQWPCAAGFLPIPSFRGYDYIAAELASHGVVVVSISANGINAGDGSVADLGMLARAELMQKHLDIWNVFNTVGAPPFGTTFVGKLDLNNVGTMGHSRGGEGAARHFLLNKSLGSPYGIKAVFPLAPVDFARPVINEVPLGVMLPYCDGDVWDLQGIHFYDDARYNVPGDSTPKHSILVLGANHNFFNTVWTPPFPGGEDDWTAFVGGFADPQCGVQAPTGRLSAAQQRVVGLAYISGFFRLYLLGQTAISTIFSGGPERPAIIGNARVFPSYHAPDTPATRRDVNRLLHPLNLLVNTAGGGVVPVGISPYYLCGGPAPQPQRCLANQSDERQPHTTPSFLAPAARGLSQLNGGWISTTATYSNDLPATSRNVSGFAAFLFRASVNFAGPRNPPGLPQDFKVRLIDGAGGTASVAVSAFSDALFFPPGNTGPIPKILLNTIRVPLNAFSGVNLTDVRRITFEFSERTTGSLFISDLAFAQ